MIKSTFSNGGFVLHKIPTRSGASTLSAWYDDEGNLLDCEAINILGNTYKPSKADTAHCTTLGPIWKYN